MAPPSRRPVTRCFRADKAAAAEQHKQARLAQLQTYPTRPAQGEQANPRPDTTTTAAPVVLGERDTDWTTIGLGIAAALLAIAAIAHHTRSGRARITA